MDGIHDLGGMMGFGPVEREENEPPFHARWEAVMVALQGATRAVMNIDEFRHGIERMDPAHYLTSTYYEHWLDGISRVLIEKGIVTSEELDARAALIASRPEAVPTEAPETPAGAAERRRGGWVARPATAPPRFQPGDTVITRNEHPRGHTRLPRYARGKRGVIHRLHGVHVFPDTNAHGLGEQPQPLYSVRFEAGELWGAAAEPHQEIFLDLWEPYLSRYPSALES
ncbi:MAG TPA: nitrile hydratase subunit beta [Dehalococcoidia bacterium]|nr:nitrile hydratase subunit beta [Dehalococcoidia bacterium]